MEDVDNVAITSDFSSCAEPPTCMTKEYRHLKSALTGHENLMPDYSSPEPNAEAIVQALTSLQRKLRDLERKTPITRKRQKDEEIMMQSTTKPVSKLKRKAVMVEHSHPVSCCKSGRALGVSHCQHCIPRPGRHYRMDLKDVPFILSAGRLERSKNKSCSKYHQLNMSMSTSPSYSITANYQEVLATMKCHSPILCGSATVKKHPMYSGNLKSVLTSLEEEFGRLTFQHQEHVQLMATNPTMSCRGGAEDLQTLEDQIRRKANQIQVITKEIGTSYHEPSCYRKHQQVVKDRDTNVKFLHRLKSIKHTLQKGDLCWE